MCPTEMHSSLHACLNASAHTHARMHAHTHTHVHMCTHACEHIFLSMMPKHCLTVYLMSNHHMMKHKTNPWLQDQDHKLPELWWQGRGGWGSDTWAEEMLAAIGRRSQKGWWWHGTEQLTVLCPLDLGQKSLCWLVLWHLQQNVNFRWLQSQQEVC